MAIRRTAHAIYDTKYHLVWAPKYRKWIKREDIREKVKEVFREVAERHEYEIEEMNVAPDHVHIFLSFPPRYSIAHVVGVLKSISAAEVFEKFPEVKKELWGGEFWEETREWKSTCFPSHPKRTRSSSINSIRKRNTIHRGFGVNPMRLPCFGLRQ